jgi:hypothetical protein
MGDDLHPCRVAPASDVRRLIRNAAVTALFQPIVELDSGRVVEYEAVARGPGGPLGAPDDPPAAMFHGADGLTDDPQRVLEMTERAGCTTRGAAPHGAAGPRAERDGGARCRARAPARAAHSSTDSRGARRV